MKLAMESPPQRVRIPAGAGIGTVCIEGEEANGGVGLDVVDLVDPAVKSKLDLVRAVHLVERGRKLSGVLAQPVVSVRIGADVGITSTRVLIDKDRWHPLESVALQVRGESQMCRADR